MAAEVAAAGRASASVAAVGAAHRSKAAFPNRSIALYPRQPTATPLESFRRRRSRRCAEVRSSDRSRAAVSMSVSTGGDGAGGGEKKLRVLFVCLGNICRSPSAEAVFRDVVKRQGLEDAFFIDSAGTYGYHEGEPADARMRKAAANRGIDITSISRAIRPSDFKDFDVILAMDKQNLADIQKAYKMWNKAGGLPSNALERVELMCRYCKKFDVEEVPDPYYGGPQGFETVLDLLDDACSQLLEALKPRENA